jgi:two-component system cell cycle sensor histidine kinase/response regulator CckA
MKVAKSITVVYALSIAIVAGVFILDLLTPIGYAVWLGYLLPLIIAIWKLQRWFVYTLTSVCTVFIALDFIYSPPGVKSDIALFNSSLAVFTLWIAIILLVGRKRAEERIREQASLLDNAQEAIGVRDLEHRLIYWNKGAQRLYGWTKKEAIGKNPVEFLFKDKEEPPQLIEAKRIVLEKGEWTGELHQMTKDSKEIIVESHWTLVRDSEEKPKSILVVNTDITEKKKLEMQLLRSQRMESIGMLAGGIAHDLNNILTPMMLSVKMLKQKLKDEQSQNMLNILENNSQRGANLIKQVLAFARGVEGEHNPLKMKHLISEIEKVAKEIFPRNIKTRTDIQKDLWTISGDATQLHQVIMNLCVNARDAMPDGGILGILAENILIDENYARMHTGAKVGQYVAIEVSDSGTGIPPEIIDRIFEPFFTTKEPGKGTGLGLSTSLGIVKSHGGFIDVHSEVGKGTAFRVYLPAIKTETQEVQIQQPELQLGQGELILVAEDEGSIREITCSTLETYGYKILSAEDGAEALAVYAQNKDKIKVVLMDLMMPVMDGETSIRAIHKINPEVKIIALSGLAEEDRLTNIANQTEAFLPKPYTAEKLLKTIHEVLSAK